MEFAADEIFREIYELQEIINFILSENRIDWVYIVGKEDDGNKENIYDDILGNKENLLGDIYFGEYKRTEKNSEKNEPTTKIQKEYTEKYEEKIKNTENIIYETIQKRKYEFERLFENIFYEKDNFYILKDYVENQKSDGNIKNIFRVIYDDKKEEIEKESIDTIWQKEFREKEILKTEDRIYFLGEEIFRNIFEKNENSSSYKFDNILNYIKNEQNIYSERNKQRYKKENDKDVNIILNNYNSEYSTTDEESIINSIAEKIMEYARCGAEGVHI